MTALNTGVYLDRCTDIGRLENVHIHPNFWATMGGISEPQETVLNSHTKANLTAFKFGRVDWELLNGCFTIFSKIGFHFVRGGEVGASSHMDAGVEAINTGADDSIYPLWVEYSAVGQGLNFINGNFLGNTIIGPNNQGPVRFKNCVFFQANFPQDILIEKFGRGTLFLDGCWFSLWNQANKGRGALDIWEGTAHISNFEFQESEVNNDQIFHITALRVKGGKVNVTNGNFRGHGILNDGGSVNVSDVFMGPEMDKADNWTGIVNVSGSMNVTNANLSAPSALGNAWISRAGGVLNQVNVIP
jgi:hypothetical protein